jgi:predicted N-formylglutamate amidohydrolase
MDRLSSLVDQRVAKGPSALVGVHSAYTGVAGAVAPLGCRSPVGSRCTHGGATIGVLAGAGRGPIGDNEPYSGRLPASDATSTRREHGGLPHVSVEVRQDGLLTPLGLRRWRIRWRLRSRRYCTDWA